MGLGLSMRRSNSHRCIQSHRPYVCKVCRQEALPNLSSITKETPLEHRGIYCPKCSIELLPDEADRNYRARAKRYLAKEQRI